MKTCVFGLLVVLILSFNRPAHCKEELPLYAAAQQPPLSPAALRALEHACKLVAAINALDWKTVDSAIPQANSFLPRLKQDATVQKEWGGVGAYRGSDIRKDDETLIHRFAYGVGRNHPHEVWLHYSLRDGSFTMIGFSILGW